MSALPGHPQASHALALLRTNDKWRENALCTEVSPELFFPNKGELDLSREAKRICAQCDVRTECLEYALNNGERYGVWGGMSERQRRELEQRRRAKVFAS